MLTEPSLPRCAVPLRGSLPVAHPRLRPKVYSDSADLFRYRRITPPRNAVIVNQGGPVPVTIVTSRQELMQAAESIKLEHRRCSASIELTCRGVERVAEDDLLFRLDVGAFTTFDWTWEGARAFNRLDSDEEAHSGWSGEIVEVNADEGVLYVNSQSDRPPTTGRFLVQPFGYLQALHDVYCRGPQTAYEADLAANLLRTLGEPSVEPHSSESSTLESAWNDKWGIIWGPPGTGKTWTIGDRVADQLAEGTGRLLVVSTTNKATDGVALSIGRAVRKLGLSLDGINRVGSGASIDQFENENLKSLLGTGQAELRRQFAATLAAYQRSTTAPERAALYRRMQEIRRALKQGDSFRDSDVRVVICTLHYAACQLAKSVMKQRATLEPLFDTVVLDEAGLVCRAATAALALLSANRLIQAGDPLQLAPISRMSRVVARKQGRWIGDSAIAHLAKRESTTPRNVHLLVDQHRMCPEIRNLVSHYQYGGLLRDAPSVAQRSFPRQAPLDQTSPATWYVLDEEPVPVAHIRAERGPGNQSWIRRGTTRVLERIYNSHPGLQRANVLFLSPFAAQVRFVKQHLTGLGAVSWTAASVHSQQGAEADVVIFDTVNASSTAWSHDEWKRLVNVAISRARYQVIVLASRDEMRQPYLSSLGAGLVPKRLHGTGGVYKWTDVATKTTHSASEKIRECREGLGYQLETRRQMRPILSSEQQTLIERELDGKPRLVRGVAGSGKTVVLAHWVVQTLSRREHDGDRVWIVYGNQSLRFLLQRLIEDAWKRRFPALEVPWQYVQLRHVGDVLKDLLTELHLPLPTRGFEFEAWAASCLQRLGGRDIDPRCDVLFIDEAQDLGHDTLRLLTQLVKPRGDDTAARAVMLFYDNAQNVYGRSTPRWSDFGLDMRGRSTVMKESFRSTRPITEFALNVLYRLWGPENDPDLKELIEQRLVEQTERGGRRWFVVHYNQIDGPLPEFNQFASLQDELNALASTAREWILTDGVRPQDIKILCNQGWYRDRVLGALRRTFAGSDVRVEEGGPSGLSREDDVLVVSTAHSFKGYEAEIVMVPGVERFRAKGPGILHSPLYVALTRARSILWTSGVSRKDDDGRSIVMSMNDCWEDQRQRLAVAPGLTPFEQRHDLVQRIGGHHSDWFDAIHERYAINEGPIVADDGRIIAQPLFWIEDDGRIAACFGQEELPTAVQDKLDDFGVHVLVPGAPI